jgi:7-carboxy-7-deazaguanine synthase
VIQLNVQPVEKSWLDPAGRLEVVDVWDTIQGEGPFAGMPAVFVRLAGCDLQCPLCDTDYTSKRETYTTNELWNAVVACRHRGRAGTAGLIVLTGGEPFRQNIAPFCRLALGYGWQVQVETNGTLSLEDFPYSAPELTLVCSPKAGKIDARIREHCRHYKYVVEMGEVDTTDGLPLSVLGNDVRVARPWPGPMYKTTVWVQPQDEQDSVRNGLNVNAVVEICLKYGYRLSYQVHKAINVR